MKVGVKGNSVGEGMYVGREVGEENIGLIRSRKTKFMSRCPE